MLLLLLACWRNPSEVLLTSVLLDRREGEGLSGAGIEVHDASGVYFGDGQTGEGGAFEVKVPASQAFFLTFQHEEGGFVPTSFAGLAGASDLSAEEGLLYMRSAEEIAALREEFSACPAASAEGAIVEGEVKLWFNVEEKDELPTVKDVTVTAFDEDDQAWTACYLDEEGGSLPDATATSSNGRFAIFGLPEAALAVAFTWNLAEGLETTNWYLVRAPEAGVSPMYPAWIESP